GRTWPGNRQPPSAARWLRDARSAQRRARQAAGRARVAQPQSLPRPPPSARRVAPMPAAEARCRSPIRRARPRRPARAEGSQDARPRAARRRSRSPRRDPMGNDAAVTRATDLGIKIGTLPAGPTNSIVDVPGVGVGHATVWRDEPQPPVGRGIARTGVTVVDLGGNLFRSPVPAGDAVLNGAGECTGFLAAREWGLAETPVFLTSTMQLGRVYDAACERLMAEDPGIGSEDVIIPIVAECDDSFLNDARRMQVTRADVAAALAEARASVGGPAPSEGAVGAGTGMSCLGFKGGIGTASRLVAGHTLGVLVLTNFGERDRLSIGGVPAGRLLPEPGPATAASPPPAGSC